MMSANKLPSQRDIDSEILRLDNPMALFWWLTLVASLLIFVVSWLVLFVVMVAGWFTWSFWPFVALPVLLWLILLALPALFHARRGALAILDALATSAEAWLARAGYSVDLNRDGYIGHVQPVAMEPVTEVRPMLVHTVGTQGMKLVNSDAKLHPELVSDAAGVPSEPETRLQLQRQVWTLPSGLKVPQETVEQFVDGVFVKGWSRSAWVGKGKPLDRDTYDGLIELLEQVGLLTGRKPGHAGKLAVRTTRAARGVLKLPDLPG
jgi:hypothetical protein